MKILNILKVALVVSSISVSNIMAAPYSCSNNISCDTKLIRDRDRRIVSSTITCSIPSLSNSGADLNVSAKNVFDYNGNLQHYWSSGDTVCYVMQWIDVSLAKYKKKIPSIS